MITEKLGSASMIVAFRETEKVFPFQINGIQSDNGSENRGVFHQYLGERGIAYYFIPKSSPTWDGVVKRVHGVIDQEYYLNTARPWKTLTEYLHWYNYERIHLGKYLNGFIPVEKLNQYLLTASPLKVNWTNHLLHRESSLYCARQCAVLIIFYFVPLWKMNYNNLNENETI